MAPIISVESIDPDTVDWYNNRKGGGQERDGGITNVVNQTLQAIQEKGAAKLTFEGNDPQYGSHSVEAYAWAGTLRRRFKEDEHEVRIKTDSMPDKTELNITFKT